MSIIKWKKDELFPDVNSIWDDFFSKDFYNKGLELGTSVPAANITEEKDEFAIEVAVPGGRKEDFNLDVEGDYLTVSSEKKEEKEEKDGDKVTRREFNYSSFRRGFQLPENVDWDKIKAQYKEGILKIHLPKNPALKSDHKKKIEIG